MKVKDITNRRKEFIKIARYHGADEQLAQDVTQDMFFKLCEIEMKEGSINRICYKGELNMVFIFNSIRNMIFTIKKRAKKVVYSDNLSYVVFDEQPGYLVKDAEEIIKKEGYYYQQLFNVYFVLNDISIRKLSTETKIGVNTLFNGIKHIKTKLKESI